MANKECTACIHKAVCKTAESCDGYVPGCKHFKEGWIPAKDRLPTEEDAIEGGFVLANTEEKVIIALWSDVCRFNDFVTHWMPLPQPPKGE